MPKIVKPVAVKTATKSVPAKAVAKPVKQEAPVVKSKGDPSQDYRGWRKHPVKFIERYLEDPVALRARIKGMKDASLVKLCGDITLFELVMYLRAIENDPRKSQLRGQPGPDGKPRRPGRPRKEEAVAAPPAKVNTKATLAAAAAGKTLAKKAAVPTPAAKKPMAKPLKK